MPKHDTVRRLRVFVASPGDVGPERASLPEVVARLNRGIGRADGVDLDLWRWEVDAHPALGEPQALINPELDEADVVVVILWKRMGTPTASAASGTEEELVRSVRRWRATGSPRVHVYACKRPVPMEELADERALAQLAAVQRFVRSIDGMALVGSFTTTEEFATKVHDDLQATVRELLAASPARSADPSASTVRSVPHAAAEREWSIARDFERHDRARAYRLRDEARAALGREGYPDEVRDSFATAFAELFNNASTHADPAADGAIRVACEVNPTFASLTVHNPGDAPVELVEWLAEARERLERDPFAPGGRGLRLLQELSDEFRAVDGSGLAAVFYRERVALVVEAAADITVVRVRCGHKNPSLAARINRRIVELSPQKLILDLGGGHLPASREWDDEGASVVRLSQRVYDSTRPHSGTTTAIGPCLPYFAHRNWMWRIVCPSEGLRALLPREITHATMAEALAALRAVGDEPAEPPRAQRWRPRPNDHLVEPFFGGLGVEDEEREGPAESSADGPAPAPGGLLAALTRWLRRG